MTRQNIEKYFAPIWAALPTDGSGMTYAEIQDAMRPTVGLDMVRAAVRGLVANGLLEQVSTVKGSLGRKVFKRAVGREPIRSSPDGLIAEVLKLVASKPNNAPKLGLPKDALASKGWNGVVPVPADRKRTANAAIQLLKAFERGEAVS